MGELTGGEPPSPGSAYGVVVHLRPAGVAEHPVAVPAPRDAEGRHVTVTGEIDILTAPELDRLLHRQLDDVAAGASLVLDLSGVSHFSAAGLHVLQRAAGTARDRGIDFRIGRASGQVDRILRICEVDIPVSLRPVQGGSENGRRGSKVNHLRLGSASARRDTGRGAVTHHSVHTAREPRDTSRTHTTALRATALLAVLTILWQGATAGGILMHSATSRELHEAGAIAVHVLTGLTAIAAFLLRRTAGGPLWPTVVAAVVFAASFVQAALGDDETMWAHVPGALLLMLGSAAVFVWALLAGRLQRD